MIMEGPDGQHAAAHRATERQREDPITEQPTHLLRQVCYDTLVDPDGWRTCWKEFLTMWKVEAHEGSMPHSNEALQIAYKLYRDAGTMHVVRDQTNAGNVIEGATRDKPDFRKLSATEAKAIKRTYTDNTSWIQCLECKRWAKMCGHSPNTHLRISKLCFLSQGCRVTNTTGKTKLEKCARCNRRVPHPAASQSLACAHVSNLTNVHAEHMCPHSIGACGNIPGLRYRNEDDRSVIVSLCQGQQQPGVVVDGHTPMHSLAKADRRASVLRIAGWAFS